MKKDKVFNTIFIIVVFITIVVFSFMMSNRNSNREYARKAEVTILNVNTINVDEYVDIYNGNKLSFIYIGKDDCSYCREQNKVLKEILDEYDITINYINLNKLASTDVEEKILPSLNMYTTSLGTPMLILVKDGKIKMFKKGYTSKDKLIELLKDNDFI